MAEYKLTGSGGILRGTSHIPENLSNIDWQIYRAWLAAGNVPDPADVAPPQYTQRESFYRTVRTTGNTPTELLRATLAQGRGYVAQYQIMAIQDGSPYNMLYGEWRQGAKRVSTTAALVGGHIPLFAPQGDAAAAGLAVTPSVSGPDFVLMVTGLSGVPIRWILEGSYIQGSPVDIGA